QTSSHPDRRIEPMREDTTELTGVGEIAALLGQGTEYTGTLAFEGRVRIEGRFRGEIRSDGVLVLGEGAHVDGDVEVGSLIVRGGILKGNVRASQAVELHAKGAIVGDIHAPQVFIARGARFEGRCTMEQGEQHDLPEDKLLDEGPNLVADVER
ncbi:MAG: polymer-forming cytoskeletal protein, partial [Myxococcales bacterium]|nr:polymer-forming cytoskeletal protein [Myxococcales bacterium]